MRKLGLIAAVTGAAILALGLGLGTHPATWVLLAGSALLLGGIAGEIAARLNAAAARGRHAGVQPMPGADTARLLDNFEQRFAELKARKPNSTILGDLYTLATQLEQRGRTLQATAVFRHLARVDGSYRDVSSRLTRLINAERGAAKLAGAKPAGANRVAKPAIAKPAVAGNAAAPAAKPGPRPGTPSVGAASNGASAAAGAAAGAPAASAAGTDPAQLGRYRLEREIGRGAMGVVYLGRDLAINRLVAIKAIPLASEFSDAELAEARARFFREAETAGRLNHPNIVTIYDVGEERGLAYIAMEYLKGHHLSDYSATDKLLEPRKVLELARRTADALGFAHKQQVVHRDIKPANLMYDANSDTLKITDFGIARITDAGNTRTGIVLGTPSFMSPEQLDGRTVTGHSDLFSLGVSLFQLLTGHLPFTADSMTGLMQQIAETPHPPVRAFRPDLPACVEDVVNRALAKDPEARFESGAQMAAALDDCKMRIPSGTP